MKKTLKLFLILTALFVLGGCSKTLDTPTDVKITEHTLQWSEVKDAEGYIVKVGENEHSTTTNVFNLLTLDLGEGTYQVSVKATGKDKKDSSYSNAISYVVNAESTSLATPTNLVITNGVLSWDQVANAFSYVVSVNGVEIETKILSIDVADYVIKIGAYPVTVKAISNNATITDSVAAEVTLNFDNDLLTLKTNELVNLLLSPYDWVLGMKEEDFEFSEVYQVYLGVVEESNLLAGEFIDSEVVVNTFKQYLNIVNDAQMADDPLEFIKQTFQNFDSYGIAPNQVANFFVIMTKYAINSNIEMYDSRILAIENYINSTQSELQNLLNEYQVSKNELQDFINNANLDLADFIALNNDYRNLFLNLFNDSSFNFWAFSPDLINMIKEVKDREYELQDELAKGPDADQYKITNLENFINNYMIMLDDRLRDDWQDWLGDYESRLNFINEVGNKYYQIIEYLYSYEIADIQSVYLFFEQHVNNELNYYLPEINYLHDRINEHELDLLNSQQAQQEMQSLLTMLELEDVQKLMKMSINQSLKLIGELNWELIEAFIESTQLEEPPAPAFLVEVVHEVARLMRIATDYDHAEYVDLALNILLQMVPDLAEDQRLAIRSLAIHTLPAVTDLLITIIENVDESFFTTLFTLMEMNPEDTTKVDPSQAAYFNPDVVIMVADMYNKVLSANVLNLIIELEEAYDSIAVLYDGLPVFDFAEIKALVTSINNNIAEIAGYQIIEEGYYPANQIEKMFEVIDSIQELLDFLGLTNTTPDVLPEDTYL